VKKDLFGAHLSVAGGLDNVFSRATEVGAHAVQIFTKSNKAYFAKSLTSDEIAQFTAAWEQSSVDVVVVHAAYLINLASSDSDVEKKSISSLRAEIERCQQLGISYLVLHPGSHTGSGTAVGIEKIARNLSAVLRATPGTCMVLLETAAGQGTNIGSTFEEIRALYDACDLAIQSRVGVCFDTCHVFASGYDLSSVAAYEAVWQQFAAVVGQQLLKVVHLNDSMGERGDRKDRHANIGTGKIPPAVLVQCAHDLSALGIPIILETPSVDGITEYKKEIALLRGK
jgi:deoxyribonuclease-4